MEKKACDEMFRFRDHNDHDEKKEHEKDVFHVQNLEPPKMKTCLQELVKKLFYGDVTRVVFRTRTIGTQTHANENEFEFEFEKDKEITEDEVLPLCETCGQRMDVYGPLGLKRSQHFGKYFVMCKVCQKRADSKTTKYFKLGFKPRCPTNSTMPRNMREIQDYITLNK